jgi:hypothetical protein
MLTLAHGLEFADLYTIDGAHRIDRVFVAHLRDADPALANRLDAARRDPETLALKDESSLLIDIAPHLEDFLGHLFGIATEVLAL